MYKSLFLLVVTTLLVVGCRPDLSEPAPEVNTNVNSNENSADVVVDVPEEKIEVPTFEDASEAFEKGTEYLDKNKIEPAINALKQASELDPEMGDAHYQLAVALALRESEEDDRVPVGSNDEDGSKKPKKEKKRDSEKSFENAIKAYRKQIAKDRKDHEAHFGMGRAYAKLYEDQKARKALEQAVKLNGEDALYRTELGDVLVKLAQYPAAIKQLNKALVLDEENYRAEDLLEDAKDGRKRVQFSKTPRTRESGSTSAAPRSGSKSKSSGKKTEPGAPDAGAPKKKPTPLWPPMAPTKKKTAPKAAKPKPKPE